MLKIRNLESGYGQMRVIKNISLHVSPGEIVTIIGGNGAGKTTLLRTIAGLKDVRSGEIEFNEKKINGTSTEKILSAGCAMVPEGRQIFSTLTVRENLILGACRRGAGRMQKNIEEMMKLFPILSERSGQLAGTLSGGEQQMLALSRALMSEPSMLMLDEPSMGIAPLQVQEIFRKIKELRNEGMTILIVEQNARAALGIADRGYVLETGQIVIEGSSDELLNNHDVQRAYLGREYERINE